MSATLPDEISAEVWRLGHRIGELMEIDTSLLASERAELENCHEKLSELLSKLVKEAA